MAFIFPKTLRGARGAAPLARRGTQSWAQPMRTALIGLLCAMMTFMSPVRVEARSLTNGERTALFESVAAFNAAMGSMDLRRVVDVVPPRLLDHIGRQAGVSRPQLIEAMVAAMQTGFAQITIESFSMDVDAARYATTSNGEPYAFIPTRTIVSTNAGRLRTNSNALALIDGGKWYLLTLDDPGNLQLFRQLYPQFQGVTFPKGSMEAIR